MQVKMGRRLVVFETTHPFRLGTWDAGTLFRCFCFLFCLFLILQCLPLIFIILLSSYEWINTIAFQVLHIGSVLTLSASSSLRLQSMLKDSGLKRGKLPLGHLPEFISKEGLQQTSSTHLSVGSVDPGGYPVVPPPPPQRPSGQQETGKQHPRRPQPTPPPHPKMKTRTVLAVRGRIILASNPYVLNSLATLSFFSFAIWKWQFNLSQGVV